MTRTIYAYFNADDLAELLKSLREKSITLFDNEQRQMLNLPSITVGVKEIRLNSQENGCVTFSPCSYLGNHLQCGLFCLPQDDCCASSLKLFSQIKNNIHHIFSYSKENACYYGPGVYDDWMNKRVRLPILLDCDRVELPADRVQSLLSTIKDTCFSVAPNNVRLRDINKTDMLMPSFIIYTNKDLLVKTIIRKTIIHYEYDSACIFVYEDARKKKYSAVFDKRLTRNSPELSALFDKLKTGQGTDLCLDAKLI